MTPKETRKYLLKYGWVSNGELGKKELWQARNIWSNKTNPNAKWITRGEAMATQRSLLQMLSCNPKGRE